jgi:hypothetical protein
MLIFQHDVQRTLAATPHAVFSVLGDPARHAELAGSGEVKAVRLRDDSQIGVGSSFEADETRCADRPCGLRSYLGACPPRRVRDVADGGAHGRGVPGRQRGSRRRRGRQAGHRVYRDVGDGPPKPRSAMLRLRL